MDELIVDASFRSLPAVSQEQFYVSISRGHDTCRVFTDDALHQLYKGANLWSGPGLNEFIAKVAKLPLKHQPGDAFTYGINSDVLGALIERVSGQNFGAFLEARICAPLSMKDTAFDVLPEKMNRLAKTYKHRADGIGLEDDVKLHRPG